MASCVENFREDVLLPLCLSCKDIIQGNLVSNVSWENYHYYLHVDQCVDWVNPFQISLQPHQIYYMTLTQYEELGFSWSLHK